MSQITEDNWNYCNYKSENLKAIISFGADPEDEKMDLLYFVTLLDEENNEIHQKKFTILKDAVDNINTKYHDLWDFEDLGNKNSSGGGCSTCVAH